MKSKEILAIGVIRDIHFRDVLASSSFFDALHGVYRVLDLISLGDGGIIYRVVTEFDMNPLDFLYLEG